MLLRLRGLFEESDGLVVLVVDDEMTSFNGFFRFSDSMTVLMIVIHSSIQFSNCPNNISLERYSWNLLISKRLLVLPLLLLLLLTLLLSVSDDTDDCVSNGGNGSFTL